MLNIGIPKQRSRQSEKYPNTPVLTMLPDEGPRFGKRFSLNKKAAEVLGITPENKANVAFSFGESTAIVNVTGVNTLPEDQVYSVSQKNTFSNGQLHKHLAKINDLSTDATHEFSLGDVAIDDDLKCNYANISLITGETEPETVPEDATRSYRTRV